jgi:hypothetical protein
MRGRTNGPLREEEHDMRTTRHPIRYVLSFVGMGLMLAGLFGGPVLPTASAADVELFVSQNDRGYQNPYGYQYPWGQQDYWGQRDRRGQQDRWGSRHDRPSRRSGYGLPDHYTIHKGKKCEVQCTRIRGSREYTCREYRC